MAKAKQTKRVYELLQISEWETFEVKRAEAKPKQLLETICAFSNTQGGVLAIGVEDPNKAEGEDRLYGISEHEDHVSELLKLLRTEFEPPLQHFIRVYEEPIINREGGQDKICIVRVQKSDDLHSLKNGDTFVRRGSQNVKIGAQEILRLRYERGSIKFEDEISVVNSIEDLDTEMLRTYQADTASQSQDAWQFLKDNGLAKTVRNKPVLTNAGVLLLGKNPAVLLSRAQ